ncbi:MAG: class I SAM-dependent methyltransferase [Bacteroidetes bacterium]|nr:class I SAM-dependent methyltransferase [Bacteroidota bacterium]
MMSSLAQRVRRLFRPGDLWNLDVDLRYMPFVRRIRRENPERILEVGSGPFGITPYVQNVIIGCDASFSETPAPGLIPVIARNRLPFRDRAFDTTLSLDTLEHVPRDARDAFIEELLRVTDRLLLIGFPEGEAAARHDLALEHYYARNKGEVHPFFIEHRTYGVPLPGEFETLVRTAAERLHLRCAVARTNNVSIGLRALFMRLLWHTHPLAWKAYFGLSVFSRMDWLFHWGTCYRALYSVTVQRTPTGKEGERR